MKGFISLLAIAVIIVAIACSSKEMMKHQRNVIQQNQSDNAFKELGRETSK